MKIKATREQIQEALDTANKGFDGNLEFNNFTQNGRGYLVTLRVKDSHGKGARLGQYQHPTTGNRRHLINACWHAHGTFFDALPEGTTIRVGGQDPIHPGDEWQDWNIGSMMYPLFFSEACEC